jgi:phage-related minor tail protein
MPQRTTATRAVRGGASRARDAGQTAYDRLTQSLEMAQAALKDLRRELSKGTRDVLDDLDATLKDARKNVRSVSRTVTKDLEQIQQALTAGKPAEPRAARPRRTAAEPTTARKRTAAAKAAPARKTTAAGARRTSARAAKPTAAASEQKPPTAPTAENENGSATAGE